LASASLVIVFEKHPHLCGSELSGWLETIEPVADRVLQAWSHSEASGAMTLMFLALSFGPATLTKATICLPVYVIVS